MQGRCQGPVSGAESVRVRVVERSEGGREQRIGGGGVLDTACTVIGAGGALDTACAV